MKVAGIALVDHFIHGTTALSAQTGVTAGSIPERRERRGGRQGRGRRRAGGMRMLEMGSGEAPVVLWGMRRRARSGLECDNSGHDSRRR